MIEDASKIPDELNKLVNSIDLTPLYSEIGEILLSSVGRNFREGGRYDYGDKPGEFVGGAKKWIESYRAKEQGGTTLRDKGILANSITAQVSSDGVIIGTNMVYAAIQNFGGKAGRNKSVTIPEHPFLVIQDEDYTEIGEAVSVYFAAKLNT